MKENQSIWKIIFSPDSITRENSLTQIPRFVKLMLVKFWNFSGGSLQERDFSLVEY